MIYEKSCGAVIYVEDGGRRLYLVELMQKGHCSICKGLFLMQSRRYPTRCRNTGKAGISYISPFSRSTSVCIRAERRRLYLLTD